MSIHKLLYQGIIWRGIYFISAFALNIVLARQLEAANSGLLFYAINIFTLLLLILSLGTESAIGYFTANDGINSSKLVNFSVLFALAITVIVAAGVGFYLYFQRDFTGSKLMLPLILSICFITGNYLIGCGTMLFYSRHDFLTPNLISSILNVLMIIAFAFLIDNNHFIYIIYLAAFLVLGVLIMLAFIFKSRTRLANPGDTFKFRLPSGPEFQKLFAYSISAFAGNVIFFLLYRVDYWFVQEFCTPDDLGNYIQVSKIAQMFFILPGILASAIFPYTASGNSEVMNRTLTQLCRALLMLYGTACLLLALAGKWLFPWLYGETFSNMYRPFLLLIPGILALSTLFTLTAFYAGKNRLMVNLKGALIALVIVVGGDIIFIPKYGINAAALVSSAGYICYHIYVLRIFRKEYNTPLKDFFSLRLSDIGKFRDYFKNKFTTGNQ